MIKVNNLMKIYNGSEQTVVINNISLDIKKGDFVSIIGQSGSGKSKLLHLIGGLDSPTSGEILVDGNDITKLKDKDLSDYRREYIGFIFQDFLLDEKKTVLQNVIAPMIYNGVHKIERKKLALKALDDVGLIHKAKVVANTLSGGQKQRVAIARALVNNPKLLLADEPTGSLDSKAGKDIMELLKSLNEKGYTILMVTHNIEQTKYCNKVIKISDGKVIEKYKENSKPQKDIKELIKAGFNDDKLFKEFISIIENENDKTKTQLFEDIKNSIRGNK